MNEGLHEQLLVYSMVARGDVILAEYSPFSASACSSFSALASRTSALISLSSARAPLPVGDSNSLYSFSFDNVHTFHFLLQDQLRFAVVSNQIGERKIAFLCLQRIRADFNKLYLKSNPRIDVTTLVTHALQKEFRPKLKEHVDYCVDHFRKLQKLPSVRDQVQDLKDTVLDNIKQVHEGHIKLELNETEVLRAQVDNFQRQGRDLRKKMWIHQAKVKVLAFLSCLVVAFLIWIGVCKGIECK